VTSKNHGFLLEIFSQIKKKEPIAKLLLIGTGPLQEQMQKKVKVLNLSDSVVFLGVRNDVPDIMQAMDVFLFPSIYEGLPFVLIEAQASGLPCLVSLEGVTADANITKSLEFVSLEQTPEHWACEALKHKMSVRKNMYEQICAAHYDMGEVARELEGVYLKNKFCTV